MFVNKRFEPIIKYLKDHKQATISELSDSLYISESTVRRDLADMQNAGLVTRFHGGAMLKTSYDEFSIVARQEKNAAAKEHAASIALGHLPKFETVFIDNSSSCLALARKMDFNGKTVITNSLQLAFQMSKKKDAQLYLPGGSVNFNTNAITGSTAEQFVRIFSIDLMLFSCAALGIGGAYERSMETTVLKQTVMQQSKYRMLIADHNKFGSDAMYRISDAEQIDCIITDADDETVAPYRAKGLLVYNN